MINFNNLFRQGDLVWTKNLSDNLILQRLLGDNALKQRLINQINVFLYSFADVVTVDAEEHYTRFVEQMSKKTFNPNYDPDHELSGEKYNVDKYIQINLNHYKKKLRQAYIEHLKYYVGSLDKPLGTDSKVTVGEMYTGDFESVDYARTEYLESFKDILERFTILQKRKGVSFITIMSVAMEMQSNPDIKQRDLFAGIYENASRGDRSKAQFLETITTDRPAQKIIGRFLKLLDFVGCTVNDIDPKKLNLEFIASCATFSEFLTKPYAKIEKPVKEWDNSVDIWGLKLVRGVPSKEDYNLMEIEALDNSPLSPSDVMKIQKCNAWDIPALKKIRIKHTQENTEYDDDEIASTYVLDNDTDLMKEYRSLADKIVMNTTDLLLSPRHLSQGDKKFREHEIAELQRKLNHIEMQMKNYNKREYTTKEIQLDGSNTEVVNTIRTALANHQEYLQCHNSASMLAPLEYQFEVKKLINYHVSGGTITNSFEVHYLQDNYGFILKPETKSHSGGRIPWAIYEGKKHLLIHSSGYVLNLLNSSIKSLYENFPYVKERFFDAYIKK